MKNSLHHAPFFIRGAAWSRLLKLRHIILPLLLTRQCRQTRHCAVPIKISRSLNNHEKTCIKYIYLHFKDTHFTDTPKNLTPGLTFTVTTTVLRNKFRIIFQVQCLALSFYRTGVLLYPITIRLHCMFHFRLSKLLFAKKASLWVKPLLLS